MKKLFTLTKEEFIERSMKGEVFIHEVTGNKFFYDKSKDTPFRLNNYPFLTDWGLFDKDELFRSEKQKVTIEKWLIKDVDSGEYFIMESSDVDLTLKTFPDECKVKLIETYEVEL